MNILLIGNGFDLAHGLPTKYKDFLAFCEGILEFYHQPEDKMKGFISHFIKGSYEEHYKYERKYIDELFNSINNNIWFSYFLSKKYSSGENWIDFETEISKVIQAFDELKIMIIKEEPWENVQKNNQAIILNIMQKAKKGDGTGFSLKSAIGDIKKFESFILLLENNMNMLIRALEIYLSVIINKIEIKKSVSNIKDILPDCVLSFNYTNTYSLIYGEANEISYDFIHGQANSENNLQTNNMVLGIDEYLTDDRKNCEVSFIRFKKYFQRIYKMTGCKYKQWIDEIRDSSKRSEQKWREYYPTQIPLKRFVTVHNLYIFGHSLDISDRDILKELILNDNVYTKIFYRKQYDESGSDDNGRKDLASKITNLVKIIGQDELIRRTGGDTQTIEFCLQSD